MIVPPSCLLLSVHTGGLPMYLILMTHSSNSEYNADCDWAVVELTPALLDEIRTRVSLAHEVWQKDANLYGLHFWGSTVDYFAHDLIDACQDAVATGTIDGDADQVAQDWLANLENSGHAVLPEGVDLSKFETQRTECDRMVVTVATGQRGDSDISWETSPKHTDIYITTWDVTLAKLESLIVPASSAL